MSEDLKQLKPTKPKLKAVSWKRSREIEKKQRELNRVAQSVDEAYKRGYEAGIEEAEAVLEATYLEIQKTIAPFVISLPEDWIVDDAPTNLDFSQGESLDWLKSSKVLELIKALGGQAAEDSKN